MAEALVLKSEVRNGLGGRDSARLRKNGRIPAVVYGHKETPANISVSKDDLTSILRQHARTLSVEVGGKNETVLIQEIQHDYLGSTVLHVDFRRVSADERVRTTVDIELKGIAPGVISGGVLDQPLHKIHIECPAMAIPESIRVKIDALVIGQVIHVKELDLPAGVTVLEDADAVVVQVKTAQALEVVAGAEGANEPEVITKKKEKATDEE
ncbi:50S ribosomal protein L25 [Zavarzinella formosa]|uniref:50S ribosomal protein L25 n=1 Tax=Zavarzinella formosa TaxID=360055 RepID=UPI0002D2B1D2|nr:50S ribosomal protein L25 [Zavarzinella formosa]